MGYCGIICEFNPFHNGHKYLIDKAKEITGNEIICLMSGNFMQRGEASIQNKYTRAINAVNNGANAVLEFPTIYACSNAENFASGAIKIFNALGVTHLAFGIENTTLETLQKVAKIKYENTLEFQNYFKEEIKNGNNYSKALKWTIEKYLNDDDIKSQILDKPNNILAIEYLTAMLRTNSKIIPIAINRCDNGYVSSENVGEFLSASGIRQKMQNNENIEKYIPKNAKIGKIFDKNAQNMLDMLQMLKIKLTSAEKLNMLYDYSEGIENRLKFYLNYVYTSSCDFNKIKESISTRRYRKARIDKLFLYPILNITKKLVEASYEAKPVAKLLAINKNNKSLLNNYDINKINIIVCNKDYEALSNIQKEIIEVDLVASEIYQSVTYDEHFIDKKRGTLFI